jgi:hypothetical protein
VHVQTSPTLLFLNPLRLNGVKSVPGGDNEHTEASPTRPSPGSARVNVTNKTISSHLPKAIAHVSSKQHQSPAAACLLQLVCTSVRPARGPQLSRDCNFDGLTIIQYTFGPKSAGGAKGERLLLRSHVTGRPRLAKRPLAKIATEFATLQRDLLILFAICFASRSAYETKLIHCSRGI